MRGRTYTPAIAAVQGWATRLHAALFRATGGRAGGRMLGSRVLLLNTTGRRSGRRRTTPLLYLEDGGSYAVVASNGGAAAHPAWLLNLRAEPRSTVEADGRERGVRAEETTGETRERLWRRAVAMYPPYADYQKKTDREIPVLLLHPTDDGRGGDERERDRDHNDG